MNVIRYKSGQSIYSYFARNFTFSILPIVFIAIGIALIAGSSPSPYLAGKASTPLFWQFLFIVLLIPFLESFLLVYPTSIAGQAQKNQYWAALIGMTPIILMHMLEHWGKAIVVSISFFIQAFSYLELGHHNFSFRQRFIFVWLFHAANNFFFFLLLQLSQLG